MDTKVKYYLYLSILLFTGVLSWTTPYLLPIVLFVLSADMTVTSYFAKKQKLKELADLSVELHDELHKMRDELLSQIDSNKVEHSTELKSANDEIVSLQSDVKLLQSALNVSKKPFGR
jgi:hypothetical protein